MNPYWQSVLHGGAALIIGVSVLLGVWNVVVTFTHHSTSFEYRGFRL
jgi:hypothetical protein